MRGLLTALVVFLVAFPAHLATSHLLAIRRKERHLLAFLLVAAAAYPAAFAWLPWTISSSAHLPAVADFASGLAMLGFLSLGYLEFWSLIERSFTLRMLLDIAEAGDAGLTAQEIAKAYSQGRGLAWLMDKRVEDLVGAGLLVRDEGGYALTRRAEILARIVAPLEGLFGVSR